MKIFNSQARSSENGLTLLEIILVMVITGVLTIFLSGVVFYEFNMFEKLTDQTDKLEISRNSLRMMARDIRQIVEPDSIAQAYSNSLQFDDVNENTVHYELSGNKILRNDKILQDSVTDFEFFYFDDSGDPITAPVSDPSQIRTIVIELTTLLNNNQEINLTTRIYPRNF